MSTHKVEVIRVGPITKVPNSDSLGMTQVWGYTAIVRLGDIFEGDLAVYIEPDYVLPTSEENADVASHFAFLGDKRRIKAKRLRGTWSQGLLVKAWGDMKEGDDVKEFLSIVRYDPEMGKIGTDGNAESPHATLAPLWKYGIENLRRNHTEFQPGEWVYVSEKIHGCVSGDTVLETLEHGSVSIEKVVNERLPVHVKSVDTVTNEVSFEKVSDWSVIPTNDNWYEIELANGKILKITGNHEVWLPKLRCWRRADQLTADDELLDVE